MSWDCEVCGGGQEDDHSGCKQALEISGSNDALRESIDSQNEILNEIRDLLKKILEKGD